jgi:hypothetical protein
MHLDAGWRHGGMWMLVMILCSIAAAWIFLLRSALGDVIADVRATMLTQRDRWH